MESLPITQASAMGSYQIYSVHILSYIYFELPLFHFIIIVYMWNTSGREAFQEK